MVGYGATIGNRTRDLILTMVRRGDCGFLAGDNPGRKYIDFQFALNVNHSITPILSKYGSFVNTYVLSYRFL